MAKGEYVPQDGTFYERRYSSTRDDYDQSKTTDETRTQARAYGGSLQAFEDEKKRLAAKADGAMGRQGYGFDLGQFDQARQQADADRGQQLYGMGMLRDQMDMSRRTAGTEAIGRSAQQAAGVQNSLATLARGGMLGQVAANRQATTGNQLAGQQAAQQSAVLRAQEAQQAALQYGQAAGQLRGLDAASQQQAGQAAEAQAANRMRTDEQNAARQRDAEALRASVLGAQQQQTIREDQQDLRKYGTDLALQQGDAARADKYAGAAASAGASALGYGAKAGAELLSDSASSGSGGGSRKARDDENLYSDERVKRDVRPLSDADAAKASREADRMYGGLSSAMRGEEIRMPVQEMDTLEMPTVEFDRGPYVPPSAAERMRRDADATARELHDATSAPMADGTRRALDRETTLPREMMRSLGGGYAYNYREGSGEDTGKRRYGVMAQDLERTPMGASIVQDTPRGKMVDTRQATGTLLASVSDLQKQLDELKARRGHG